jgi:hypothetical protein
MYNPLYYELHRQLTDRLVRAAVIVAAGNIDSWHVVAVIELEPDAVKS